jgi:carbonic anhydrase
MIPRRPFVALSLLLCTAAFLAGNRGYQEWLGQTVQNAEGRGDASLAGSDLRQQLYRQPKAVAPVDELDSVVVPSWNYSDQAAWPAPCNGRRQSPIDIERRNETWAGADLWPNFRFVTNKGTGVMNQDNAIRLFGDAFNFDSILFGNETWWLSQITFHRKSEHCINGQQFELEAELFFAPRGTNLSLVVSILFHLSDEPHPFLRDLNWEHLPSENGQGTGVSADIDLWKLMPSWPDFFYYSGSLSAPPCTEGVHRLVMLNSVGVSATQLERFPFSSNSRAVQPLNGRVVVYHHFTSSPTPSPTYNLTIVVDNVTVVQEAVVDANAAIAAEMALGLKALLAAEARERERSLATGNSQATGSAQQGGADVAAKLKRSADTPVESAAAPLTAKLPAPVKDRVAAVVK